MRSAVKSLRDELMRRHKGLRVLALSTYPLRRPVDGGQLRAAAEREYLRAQGCTVRTLSIIVDGRLSRDIESDAIVIPQADLLGLGYPWVCFDLALGRYAASEPLIARSNALINSVGGMLYSMSPPVVFTVHPVGLTGDDRTATILFGAIHSPATKNS